MQDRLEQNNLKLTQEFIADMLGVRRSGVTQTAQKLQENGLIRYHRGNVEILDLQGLEAYSCECFKTVKQEYDRLLAWGKARTFPVRVMLPSLLDKSTVQTALGR